MILEKKKRFIILTLKQEPPGSQENNFKINLTTKAISFHCLESQGEERDLALWKALICRKEIKGSAFFMSLSFHCTGEHISYYRFVYYVFI